MKLRIKWLFVIPVLSLLVLTFLVPGCRPSAPPPTPTPEPPPEQPSVPSQPDPLTQVVVDADLIVLGTITDLRYDVVKPENYAGCPVYTIFTLSVEKVLKGDPATKEVFIRLEGGYLDNEVYVGPMGWYFSMNDRVLVTLKSEHDNIYTLFHPGVLWIKGDKVIPLTGVMEVMGRVARIMRDNDIPISLQEPIPMPTGPVERPKK